MSGLKGYISQIIGPVVDVHFQTGADDQSALPSIHEALQIHRPDGRVLIVEVQQHIGEDTVRTVAMDSTDGLRRGLEAVAKCHRELSEGSDYIYIMYSDPSLHFVPFRMTLKNYFFSSQ